MLARDLPSPRQRTSSLEGTWGFWPDLQGRLPAGPGAPFVTVEARDQALGERRAAKVPSPWQALFEDLRLWAGSAWYETGFDVDEGWRDRRVRLCFGAVDYFCSVWVNGHQAGEHEGGYLPFALDVTELVRFGTPNAVTVRVLDVGPGQEDAPFRFSEIPHGKQSWYGPIGGIWQDVWIEARGAELIGGGWVRADPATGGIRVDVRGPDAVRYRVLGPDGREVLSGETGERSFEGTIRGAVPWYPDRPALYTLELASSDDGWSTTFGFRTIGTRDGMVTLNDEPVYLRGALDQDYWTGTIATPPSDEELAREMHLARELGLNLLRCHIKPPTPAYLDAADAAGVLVWCEPPSWGRLSPDAARRVRDTLGGMVERDANHPSLAAWSIVNEDWGTDLAERADDRRWLAETVAWAQELDPTRLWVDNSACPPTFHVRSNLNDFHIYRAVPEQLSSWRRWLEGWGGDPGRTYTPHGDAAATGDEPRVLSEFGIWGLPDVADIFGDAGDEPWWFDTGADDADGVVHPKGVRERFNTWGLHEVFGSWAAFVLESQEHQFEGLKAEVEDLRFDPGIAGYVITELTDVHWETNGLLGTGRTPKRLHERFAEVNGPVAVVGRPERTRYRSGDRAVIDVVVAPASAVGEPLVVWGVDELGLAGTVRAPGRIVFEIPPLQAPLTVTVRLRLADRAEVIRNETKLWLFPSDRRTGPRDVPIVRRLDEVAGAVADGGRAIVVATDEDALPRGASVRLERWDPDDDATGWHRASGLGWLHPAITTELPVGPRVDLAFLGLTADHRLRGYAPERHADVLAGHYLGWIRDVTASIAAFRYGRGSGIVCTFPLLEVDGVDPLATALLDRLAWLVADRGFTADTVL